MSAVTAQNIIDFWFDSENAQRWFKPTPEFDEECRNRFGDLITPAGLGELDHWQQDPQGTLAIILLLDQLTRNIYRGQPQAFAHDPKARAVAMTALAKSYDTQLPQTRRFFLYLPLEHSEDRSDQAHSVKLFEAYGDAEKLDYAIRHQVIIDRFGRFPHRNAVLGRASTAEEIEFLKEPNSSF